VQAGKTYLFNPYNVYGDCPVYVGQSKMSARRFMLDSANRDNEVPPCADAVGLYTLFADTKFRQAIHVTDLTSAWNICTKIDYSKDPRASYYLYPKLIKNGIRTWKFSGDVLPITKTIRLMMSSPSLVPSSGSTNCRTSTTYEPLCPGDLGSLQDRSILIDKSEAISGDSMA
jgi:hypothetical protein